MRKAAARAAQSDVAPELPALARTRSGIEFDPRPDQWAYRDATTNVRLDFARWPITKSLALSAKLVLLWYAENMSASHLSNMYERMGHFLRVVCADRGNLLGEITSIELINYKATLTGATAWYLGSLAGFLKKWHSLGLAGVTRDAVTLLKQLRIPGNRKGEAVLTHDPIRGPFTDVELETLQSALDGAFARREVPRDAYLLAYLFMMLGLRPVQYAALKVCDVSLACAQDGTRIYTLRFPRAKQRHQPSRAEFKDRLLVPQVGELLLEHCSEVRAEFGGRMQDPGQAPLFPATRRSEDEPDEFAYHRTAEAISHLLKGTLDSLKAMSERTGEQLHVTATRFRRTLGTRAAIEGHGELVIAELLDHTDTQNVGVYIEARPEILERIDRAMAMHMAPMAQAFAGVIIDDESQATRAGEPSSRVCDPRFAPSMKPMGNCGSHGFCGFAAPIACYTCVNFQPWLEGPHEAVLDFLIGERERLMVRTDQRIASVNDRTILAVAEVVRLCDARRKEMAGG